MPDNKSKDIRWLEGIATATPAVAGVGIGIRNMVRETSFTPRTSAIGNLQQFAPSIKVPRVNFSKHIDYINSSFAKGKDTDIARAAWEAAISTVDPLTQRQLRGFTGTISSMSDTEAISAIKHTMLSNESLLMNRVYNRFIRNAKALKRQRKLYPNLPIDFASVAAQKASQFGRPMSAALQERLGRIGATFGGGVWSPFTSTPEMLARGLGVYDVTIEGVPGGGLTFKLPISNQGILVEGATMQTQRIAPRVGIVRGGQIISEMSREEFFLEQLERSIVPDIKSGRLKTRADINRAVSELRDQVFNRLESSAVMEEVDLNMAQRLKNFMRGYQIQLVTEQTRKTEGKQGLVSAYRGITGEEYQEALIASQKTGRPLYGGVSPTAVSKGIASTFDISQMYLTPEAIDWGRRPEQMFREYQLSSNAINDLRRIQGERFGRYQQLQSDLMTDILEKTNMGQPMSPSLKAVYLDPARQASAIESLNLAEGHAVMRGDIAEALEFETSRTMSLSRLNQALKEQMGKGHVVASKGTALGVDEAGNVITAKEDMTILRMHARYSEAKKDYAILEYLDRQKIREGAKFFGGDKATMLLQDRATIDTMLAFASPGKENLLADTETIMRMDTLKKNRGLFRQQIISALQETQGIPATLGRQWSATAGIDDVAFVRQAMEYSLQRKIDISPEKFGLTFGLTPSILGEEQAQTLVREAAAKTGRGYEGLWGQVSRGVATGMTTIAYDTPESLKGAGTALGSVESRLFEILRDPHWGTLGQDLSEEFVERLRLTDPEKFTISEELGKTLQSMSVDTSIPRGAKVFEAEKYGKERFQQWMEGLDEKGGFIRQGRGMRDIYVPNPSVVNKMRPFTTAAGVETIGSLATTYHNIARNASEMYLQVGALSQNEVLKNLQSYQDELAYQWAPGGKGMGGYLRGQVLGSRYLRTRAGQVGIDLPDLFTAGISDEAFETMLEEMNDVADIEDMRARFQRGERIGGLVARHPFIGSFSMQQTYFQRIAGNESQIVLPEIQQELKFRDPTLQSTSIRLGPSVGLAADYDADNAAAFLVSPKNEKAIRQNLNNLNNRSTMANIQHQIRYQLLRAGKASGGVEGLSIAEKMAADVRKLGVVESWVPRLSNEMSGARAALSRFGKGVAAEDAKMLLEWLEQTPISAKHLSAQRVAAGGIEDLMRSIQASFQYRDEAGLRSVVGEMIQGDPLSQKLLTGNIELAQETAEDLSRVFGTAVPATLRGANIPDATSELMRVLKEAEATGADREMKILRGQARRVKPDEIMSSIRNTKSGGFAHVSRMATAARNVLGATGRGIIRNKKPIGWGFAGALAISAMLSSPKETIGPGNNLNIGVRPNMSPGKAVDKMTPENIMPPSPPVGSPSVPGMMIRPQVRLGSNEQSQRINVKARLGSLTNASQLSHRLSSMTNRSTSINITDNRQNMNSHRLANKLL